MPSNVLIPLVFVALGLGASWVYFHRYAITRPPIGVFNLWDVLFMFAAIIIVPMLYLVLPIWMVGGLLGLGALGIIYMTFEPVLQRRAALIWLVALVIVGGEVWVFLWADTGRTSQLLYNDVVQIVLVVGAVNLWAQSGMKARDAAILGVVLCLYDVLFTTVLTVMSDLFTRIDALAFAPLIAWPGPHGWWGLGLGDMLMAAVFPLLICKGYSRTGGLVAMLLAWLGIAGVFSLPALGLHFAGFPLMVVLGPLMLGQYLFWRQQRGRERTWRQYQLETPARAHLPSQSPAEQRQA